MNLRILGVVLIVAGCGGVGFLMAYYFKRQIRILEQVSQILGNMICELDYRMTPLPQLLRHAAETAGKEMRQFFYELSDLLTKQDAPDASDCMNQILRCHSELPGNAAATLRQLGNNLGRFDLDGQLQGLQEVRNLCRKELEALEADRVQRIRNYQTLSLCAGAALAILLL